MVDGDTVSTDVIMDGVWASYFNARLDCWWNYAVESGRVMLTTPRRLEARVRRPTELHVPRRDLDRRRRSAAALRRSQRSQRCSRV